MRYFQHITPFALLIIAAVLIACTVTIAFLSVLEWHRTNLAFSSRERFGAMQIVTADTYAEPIIIQSFNSSDKTLIASIWSATAGQFIPTKFRIADNIEIFRRDAIIENSIVVRFTEPVRSTITELAPDVRGIATVNIGTDGFLTINRIIVGVPFPRP